MAFNPAARGYTSDITVFVNAEKHELTGVHPHKTLQDFLHELGYTGTKVSCAQGACGACTVSIAQHTGGQVVERAVNACLRPLLLCDGCAVTTVEGIGSPSKPHPVQERIAVNNGSQCGYCTPGQVMSMYSLLRENKKPSAEEVEACLEGNICRCTGYRGIHAAFHTFAGKMACTDVPGHPTEYPAFTGEGEPTFPAELVNYNASKPLFSQSKEGTSKWYRVQSLQDWATIAKECGMRKPRIVVGNTSVGVFGHKVGAITNVDVSAIPELNGVKASGDITVGGAETLTTLINALQKGNAAQQTLGGSLTKIANAGIRNAGGWAGNLVMGRVLYFPSDGAVLLGAFGAKVTVAIAKDGAVSQKVMSAYEFVDDLSLNNDNYVLVSITVPATDAKFHAYRQAVSHCNAHALANAAFSTEFTASGGLKDPKVVFGCVGKRAILCKDGMSFLNGKPVTDETFQGFLEIIQKIEVEHDGTYVTGQTPEGKSAFKKQAIIGFAFKWFASLMAEQGNNSLKLATIASPGPGFLEARDSTFATSQTLSSKGQLNLPEGHPGSTYCGTKKESLEQACGQTKYSGDMPMGPRGVHGVYVTATRIGKITKIDTTEAMKQDGAVAWVGAKDVPGMNSSSLVPGEEPLFAEEGMSIIFTGQIIGVYVAKTHQQAKTGARMVKVDYTDPDTTPVFTLEDAVAKKNFLYGPDVPGKVFTTGEVDKTFENKDLVIVEGDVNVGGQNNFHMEKHTCTAMPDDMGRTLIYGAAQTPDMTKSHVMIALGCGANDVHLKIRPMGGSFGGRFTRQFSTFCASGVCAKVLNRPVRIAMNLNQEMGAAGNTRHITNCHFKVAATKEGKIMAIDNLCNVDAGCSNDYTDYMCDEILKRQDLAYDMPNYRCTLNMIKTNNPTASAVRCPGLAQAAVISESMVDAVARACKVPQEKVRELSMKPTGAATDQTNQKIDDWNMPELWAKGKAQFEFEKREKECDSFNSGSRYKKRGITLMPLKYSVGYSNMSGLKVTVGINASDGSVEVQTGCCEMGQGCATKVLSCVATELGVPMKTVSVHYPDTSVLTNLFTDGGSAGSELLCQAAKECCDTLKGRLAEVKEELLKEKKAAATDGGDVSATHTEVCARAYGAMPTDSRVLLSATSVATVPFFNDLKRTPAHPPLGGIWWHMDPQPEGIWQYYVTGVACSEVEVDVLTGGYTVLRTDIIMDAGNSMNPLLDLGQAEGGFVFGMGMYCQEETLMDPKDGRNKSEGSWNYKPPNNKDVPQIFNVELYKGNASSKTLYGSKGLGECPFILAQSIPSAIKKAIHASRQERGLPAEFRLDSPASPDRVQQAMGLRPEDLTF